MTVGVSGSYGVSEYGLDLLPGVGEDTVSDELVPVKRLFYPTNAIGTYYDPADLSTIYQDAAGTTAGAVASVVGLMLDKSQGLVLGPEVWNPSSVTVSTSGTGDAATWNASTQTLTCTAAGTNSGYPQLRIAGALQANSYYSVDFTFSGDIGSVGVFYAIGTGGGVLNKSGNRIRGIVYSGTTVANLVLTFNGTTTFSVVVSSAACKLLPGYHASQSNFGTRGILARHPITGRRNELIQTDTLSTQSVTVTAAQRTLSFTGTGTVTLSGASTAGPLVGTGASNRVSLSFTPTAGSLTLTVTGSVTLAQLELGASPTAYQKVVSTYDVTESGVESVYRMVLDGVDDYDVTVSGGGGTTGFFLCEAIRPSGGAGTARTLWSDAGTNTGYIVRLNVSNQLEIAAGNGTAYTTIATTDTLSLSTNYVITAWDDGTNLNVQLNNGTVASVARPAVSAGTAVITRGRDNGAATSPFNGSLFSGVYVKNGNTVTASLREQAKRWVAARAGVTL